MALNRDQTISVEKQQHVAHGTGSNDPMTRDHCHDLSSVIACSFETAGPCDVGSARRNKDELISCSSDWLCTAVLSEA